ncbi:hypothetical protein GGI43DRAFT_390017 [Trichoderma evansii]
MMVNILSLACKSDVAYCFLCLLSPAVVCNSELKRDTQIIKLVSIIQTSVYERSSVSFGWNLPCRIYHATSV